MFPQSKFHDLLDLLCANTATRDRLVEALDEEIERVDGILHSAALKSLFDEKQKPGAYGAYAVKDYIEGLRDFVKRR